MTNFREAARAFLGDPLGNPRPFWRAPETAPRTGERILVKVEYLGDSPWICIAQWNDRQHFWEDDGEGMPVETEPGIITGWMPLPLP